MQEQRRSEHEANLTLQETTEARRLSAQEGLTFQQPSRRQTGGGGRSPSRLARLTMWLKDRRHAF